MDPLILIVCAIIIGAGMTLAVIPLLRAQKRNGAVWEFHHTHRAPVSRLGGVALATAFVAISLAIFIGIPPSDGRMHTRWVIFLSALAMFGLGLWDDLRKLGARRKLLGQVLIALAVCAAGVRIEDFQNPFTGEIYPLGLWGALFTVIWLVALTNLVNLIDGVDGLAAGVGLMLMGLIVYVGMGSGLMYPVLIAAGMFGALAGFLFFNFPPAKIYLGDGGAYLVGYLIGILALVNSQKGTVLAALIAPMFALALPIADVSLAILRRGLRGLPIFRPDRQHLHHRLLQAGLTRRRTVLVLYGLSSICLLTAFAVVWSQGRWVPICFGFLCLILLLAARTVNFSRDWFAVGRVLENSAALRRETHYALALTRWLELEAERGATIDDIWSDFGLIARKLGFTSVQFQMNGQSRRWEGGARPDAAHLLQCAHDLGPDRDMTLTFQSDSGRMSPRLFEHLAELAAEGWFKAFAHSAALTKSSPAPVPVAALHEPVQPKDATAARVT
jgi:UDP-GlcNAc:undecaprenyl-phosphate GlcNAc-1-phosphate transferase